MKKVSYHLINNTSLEISREEALQYINYLVNKEFFYKNDNNYDGLNYEKIISIEILFQKDDEIQMKIKELKALIAENYIFKQKYLKRIKSQVFNPTITKKDCDNFKDFLYFGLPRTIKQEEDIK